MRFMHCTNPFRPALDRRIVDYPFGQSIDQVLIEHGLLDEQGCRTGAYIVSLNGQWLLQAEWGRLARPGDLVTAISLPQRGGNGSNPLAVVAMVAVMALSYGAASGAFAAGGYFAAGSTSAAFLSAGITIAGGLFVSALAAPPRPDSISGEAGSTYAIGSQGNAARLNAPIEVQYGEMRRFPALAASPYTEYRGNDQYLFQLFCLGQGRFKIDEIRIENTPIGNFSEVEYEVIQPGQPVLLFPDSVHVAAEVQGIELTATREAAGEFMGPFVANSPNTVTNRIGIDVGFPLGLTTRDGEGDLKEAFVSYRFEARAIDDAGNAIGNFFVLVQDSKYLAVNTPQYFTYNIPVPLGRYEVRGRRTNPLTDQDNDTQERIDWVGMRSYMPSQHYYGDVTLIAVVIKATNNLNSNVARRLNVLCTAIKPVWNGSAWVEQPTRSIVWAFADVFRNTVYGRGLADKRLNLAELLRLDGVYASRGDYIDAVFDTETTIWEAATRIAECGRAKPIHYSGVVEFVRDEPKIMRKASFTPDNTKPGTFSIDYAYGEHDAPDYVIVKYLDPLTYEVTAQVECVPTASPKKRPKTIELPFIKSHEQAWREGIYRAYSNRDQRKFVSLTTEYDGLAVAFGDKVVVSSDIVEWGLPGLVEHYDPATGILTVGEEIRPVDNPRLALSKRNGKQAGPYVVEYIDEFRLRILNMPAEDLDDINLDPGYAEMARYIYGPSNSLGADMVVLGCVPDENHHVTVALVNYADSPHEAENNVPIPPPRSPSLLPGVNRYPIIASIALTPTSNNGTQVLSVSPAAGAVQYEYQASKDAGASWQTLAVAADISIVTNLPAGTWRFRARGIGALAGPWISDEKQIQKIVFAPPAVVLTLQQPWTGRSFAVNVTNRLGDFRDVRILTGGVQRYAYPTTEGVIPWNIDLAKQLNAVSNAVTIAVSERNPAGSGPETFIEVNNPPPPIPLLTGSYKAFESKWKYNAVATSTETDVDHITVSAVWQEPDDEDPFGGDKTVTKSSDTGELEVITVSNKVTFTATVYDVWGGISPSVTEVVQSPITP